MTDSKIVPIEAIDPASGSIAERSIGLVLDGGNKATTSIAQWPTLVSPFKRLCHCAIKVLYKF
jgi:hypothetical protein